MSIEEEKPPREAGGLANQEDEIASAAATDALFQMSPEDLGRAATEAANLTLLQARRDQILDLASRHRAGNVRIFGSVSRGTLRVDRDIDFLVEMEAGATMFDVIGLEQALSELLGRPVDVLTETGMKHLMRDDPCRTAVKL